MSEDMTAKQAEKALKEFIATAYTRRMGADECITAIDALVKLNLKAERQDHLMELLEKGEVTFGRRKRK